MFGKDIDNKKAQIFFDEQCLLPQSNLFLRNTNKRLFIERYINLTFSLHHALTTSVVACYKQCYI